LTGPKIPFDSHQLLDPFDLKKPSKSFGEKTPYQILFHHRNLGRKFRSKKKKIWRSSLPFTLHFPKTGKEPLNDEKRKRRKNLSLHLSLILTMNLLNTTPWKMSGTTLQCLPGK
jgi:hypothetical protein